MKTALSYHNRPSFNATDPTERELAERLNRLIELTTEFHNPWYQLDRSWLPGTQKKQVDPPTSKGIKSPTEIKILRAAWRSIGEDALVAPPYTTAALVSGMTKINGELVSEVLREHWLAEHLVTAISEGMEHREEIFFPPYGDDSKEFSTAVDTANEDQSWVNRVVRRIVRRIR